MGVGGQVLTKEERAKAHAAEQAVKAAIQASRSNSTVAPKLPAVPVPPAISDMLMHIYPSLVMSRAAYEDPQVQGPSFLPCTVIASRTGRFPPSQH